MTRQAPACWSRPAGADPVPLHCSSPSPSRACQTLAVIAAQQPCLKLPTPTEQCPLLTCVTHRSARALTALRGSLFSSCPSCFLFLFPLLSAGHPAFLRWPFPGEPCSAHTSWEPLHPFLFSSCSCLMVPLVSLLLSPILPPTVIYSRRAGPL